MKGAFTFDSLAENSLLVFYFNGNYPVIYCYQDEDEMQTCLRTCNSCPLTRATIPFHYVKVQDIQDNVLKELVLSNTKNDEAVKQHILRLGYNRNNLNSKTHPIPFTRKAYNTTEAYIDRSIEVTTYSLLADAQLFPNMQRSELDRLLPSRSQTRPQNSWSAFHIAAYFLGVAAFFASLAFPGTYHFMPLLLHANPTLIIGMATITGCLSWALSYISRGIVSIFMYKTNHNRQDNPLPTLHHSRRIQPTQNSNWGSDSLVEPLLTISSENNETYGEIYIHSIH